MAYEEFKSSGITENTPKNILLGAGTIHKNLTFGYVLLTAEPSDWGTGYANYYTRSGTSPDYTYTALASATTWAADTYYKRGWNVIESLVGATSGGTKLTITPEIKDIEVDGALVKVKGLAVKIGETAIIETNLVEMTPEHIKMGIIGADGTSAYAGYNVIESKNQIENGDYITNFGYIGKKLDGTPIIIIFDNAIATSGLAVEGKNKENGVFPMTFECYADLTGDTEKLPYHIYYPTPAA